MSTNDTPLAGRVALVTGAARRVGRAIALDLARAGAAVVVHHRRGGEEVVREIVRSGGHAVALSAELADAHACRELVDRAVAFRGRLDVLVNNASPFVRQSFLAGDDEAWEKAWRDALDVTLLAPARLARRAAPALAARRGVIVNLLDIAAWQAWPHYAHHGAAKAGLAHLTRTLAVTLAPDVRCVGVAPGIVEWPDGLSEDAKRRLIARVPAGRVGTPEDITGAIRALILSPYINGAVLTVDGGRLVATGEGG